MRGHAKIRAVTNARKWTKGDAEPPADVVLLVDRFGDLITRQRDGRWAWVLVGGREAHCDVTATFWSELAVWRDANPAEVRAAGYYLWEV